MFRTKTRTNKAFDKENAAREEKAKKQMQLQMMQQQQSMTQQQQQHLSKTVLDAFDCCNSQKMFSLLERYLPPSARKPGSSLYDFTINLEFFLRVYSLIGTLMTAKSSNQVK